MYKKDFYVEVPDIGTSDYLKPIGILRILQEISALHSDQCGFGLKDISNTQVTWILVGWKVKILKLPAWSTKLHVETWSRGADRFYCYRDYRILEGDTVIAIASSKWVFFDVAKQSIDRVTDEIIQKFGQDTTRALEEDFQRLTEPPHSVSTFSYTVLRRDIDTNFHVNNLNYLVLAYEALPQDSYLLPFTDLEIMYKHSAKLGDELTCNYAKTSDTEHVITIKSKDQSKLFAIVKLSEK